MTVSEELLREALAHGTEEGRPDTQAAWQRVKERLGAPKRRPWARTAGVAVVLLAIGGGFSPHVRAAASDLWQTLLQVTLNGVHYEVQTGEFLTFPIAGGPKMVDGTERNVVGKEEEIAPLSEKAHETHHFAAEAGRFPEEAQALAVLPIRVPTLLPQRDGMVHVSVDTPDGGLTGSQYVSFSWEGDSLSDWILLAQRTRLARSTPEAEWEAVVRSDHHTISIEGALTAETVRLSESVEAVRVFTAEAVHYHFQIDGTDITLHGPQSLAELLEQMALSLAGA